MLIDSNLTSKSIIPIPQINIQVDSGADRTIINEKESINNYIEYEKPIYMYTISGSQLKILGEGNIGNLIDKVYYSTDADTNVISLKDLQNKNLLTYFPPGKDMGCIVVDPTNNNVILQTDKNYMINIQQDNNNSQNNIEKNDCDNPQNIINTVKSRVNLNNKQLSFLIPDMQRRNGYKNLHTILGIARSTQDFPFTEAQVRKHFVDFPAYHMGRMTKSSYTMDRTIRHKSLQIGTNVSTDCMPIDGAGCGIRGVQIFVDKKSSYVTTIFTTDSGSSQTLSDCVIKVKAEYLKYGHVIQTISSDSLPSYLSSSYEDKLTDLSIRHEYTAPYEHEGVFAERLIRICNEHVTTLHAAAPWIPSKLICFIIMMWAHQWNTEEGALRGISRYEEFTGIRPSANGTGNTGAIGDCYIVNFSKTQRSTGKFSNIEHQLHGKAVMYLLPDVQTKDSHLFYDPTTERVITRRSFRRVPGIPNEWLQLNDKPGPVKDINGINYDFINGPIGYDVWHKGATQEAIIHQPLMDLSRQEQDDVYPGVLVSINADDNISKRTRSQSPNDGNMLKRLKSHEPLMRLNSHEQCIHEGGRTSIDNHVKLTSTTETNRQYCCEREQYGVNNDIKVRSKGIEVHVNSPDRHGHNSKRLNGHIIDNTYKIPLKTQVEIQNVLTSNTVNMVHMLTDKNIIYGLKFIRPPTQEEIHNVKQHLKSVINKASKNKAKKYNPDNPSLIAALKSQDVDAWIKAINAEYEQHGLENTWEAVAYLPKDKPWVPSHLILVRQRLATGEIKKYKARLVANGSKQQFQTFEENSSPTAKESSVKFFYAKSATLGKIIRTFDVKGAYLKSDIDQEIYMLLPKMNNNDTSQYVRLNKSIYGLKQAGKLWYENLSSTLISFGFEKSSGDDCIFTKYDKDLDDNIDVVIYVDDILTSSGKKESADLLHKNMIHKFGVVNETTITQTHLGIHWQTLINRDIKISQPGYINKIIEELQMEDSPTEIVPFLTKHQQEQQLTIDDIHTDECTIKLRKILGLLNHLAIHTRPDILFCVADLQTKVVTATENHIQAALHIVRYLKGTHTLGLIFAYGGDTNIYAYTDAARDLSHSDSKGHTGICMKLGNIKTAMFHFSSKKQSLVTRSANEAEIFSIDKGCLDIEWLRNLTKFLKCEQNNPTIMYEDNESAIEMLEGRTKLGTQSKHIRWRYNYAFQSITEKSVTLKWISTENQIADILTKKNFIHKQFYYLRSEILNCSNNKSGI